MSKLMKLMFAPIIFAFLIGTSLTAFAQDEGAPKIKTPQGDIAVELVGQVQNIPMTPTSNQYGYLSSVNGIDSVFASTPHNETTALFTFFTVASTTQVINNGNLRIVNRTGTTTIYLDEAPNGDFSDPSTFSDGTPILTMSLKQQVILDLVENTFTTVNVNTVMEASSFTVGDSKFRLGQAGDQFRTFISGRGNTTGTPANFVIAGYVIPIEKAKP
jgi:hypothetical protein